MKKQYNIKGKVPDPFVRVFHETILDHLYSEQIDYDELSLLTSLILFVDWNSNILIDKKGKPLSINSLSKLIKKHRTWLTSKLNNLRDIGLIYLDQNNGSIVITISPKVAWKGNVS